MPDSTGDSSPCRGTRWLRFERERRLGDEFDVKFAKPYFDELAKDWVALIGEAQSELSHFVPDELCEEIVKAMDVLAKEPDHKPNGPTWKPYEELILRGDDPAEIPKFRPTHVYQSPLLCVWYVLFREFHWVGICRLELNKARGNTI